MRTFLIILILFFTFQTWAKADDIRNFEIEGMSIGNSLLNFYSKNEIKGFYYPKSKKFSRANIIINSENYDLIQFHFKTDDNKYEIFGISGQKLYKQSINDCYKKQKIISDDISKIFIKIEKKTYSKKHAADKSGKSTNNGDNFYFPDKSYINIACYDWSKKIKDEKNYTDNLRVTIIERELATWLRNEAY